MDKYAPASHNPVQKPTTAVIAPRSGPQQAGGGRCCSVPLAASRDFKSIRRAAIAVLVIHVVAVSTSGYLQLPGSLIGIIVGGIGLCQKSRCSYRVACVVISVGFVLDLCHLFSPRLWFLSPIQDDSSDDRVYAGYGADISSAQEMALVLPVALGALSFLAVGAVFTREAFRQRRRSGTHDEFPV
ncbi:unnamed protein product [Ectocarpus sp. 6 AP-2014]